MVHIDGSGLAASDGRGFEGKSVSAMRRSTEELVDERERDHDKDEDQDGSDCAGQRIGLAGAGVRMRRERCLVLKFAPRMRPSFLLTIKGL